MGKLKAVSSQLSEQVIQGPALASIVCLSASFELRFSPPRWRTFSCAVECRFAFYKRTIVRTKLWLSSHDRNVNNRPLAVVFHSGKLQWQSCSFPSDCSRFSPGESQRCAVPVATPGKPELLGSDAAAQRIGPLSGRAPLRVAANRKHFVGVYILFFLAKS
jgi:hypothetical protein